MSWVLSVCVCKVSQGTICRLQSQGLRRHPKSSASDCNVSEVRATCDMISIQEGFAKYHDQELETGVELNCGLNWLQQRSASKKNTFLMY